MNTEDQHPRLFEVPASTETEPETRRPNPDKVRVLSVPEPLATLIMLGIKGIYTTPRFTRHRGMTLLFTPGLGQLPIKRIPAEALSAIEGRQMHRQAIIGHIELTSAAPTEGLNPRFPHHHLTRLELQLDDFGPERYALYLQEPHWLTEAVPTSGRGQLWKPNQQTLTQVMRNLT